MEEKQITNEFESFIPKVHFELIPIKNLVSNQDYQRNLSMRHVRTAANNFDLYQVNPVKVSRRDGINYVFNGQHTIEIIAMVSGSRETPVWCMIYDDLGYTHEADIFANQMKYVKTLLPFEIFNANIEAGNDKQIQIRDLVESYHLHVGPSATPGNICAVSTLENIFDKYGYGVLDRTLLLCVGTWEGAKQSLSANMLNAVARLIYVYGDTLSNERFKEKVGRVSAKEISRTARDRRNGSLGYAEALVIEYNRKAPVNALSMQALYANKPARRQTPVMEDEVEEIDGPAILNMNDAIAMNSEELPSTMTIADEWS